LLRAHYERYAQRLRILHDPGIHRQAKFQKEMIELVRQRAVAGAAHIQGMTADIGQVRFRVLEVAGAVAAEVYPADFPTAVAIGQTLQGLIDSCAQAPPNDAS
jgi:hypothetical protein